MNIKSLLLPVLFVSNVFAYNILVVFPFPGKSHTILGEGYVRHLLKAGHEVTYVTPALLKPHPKLKQIDVSSNIDGFEQDTKILSFDTFLKEKIAMDSSMVYDLMLKMYNRSITHENVQYFLKESKDKYDLAIVEWLYSELYTGFAAIFNIPHVYASSLEPHPDILNLIDEPQNPAYFPEHTSPVSLPLTFAERVSELWNLIYLYFVRWHLKDTEEKVFQDAFGPAAIKRGINLPTLNKIKYETSLVFGNSHVSTGEAYKLPQNYIPIAGYHIDDQKKPLPEDLQKVMDNSPHGVIYFSMGTMMKSKTMPQEFKRGLLQVFSELKQTVIWKFEEKMDNVPKNVHIVQWAPQQSILAHPNCILFITHGGLLSTTETLHYGVPIIGIPLFADQHINVVRAVQKGFALQVDLDYDTPAKLQIAIQEILSNSKYREKVKQLSFIYHHRPTSPGQEILHWVEHIIQTKGASHLRSPAFNVPLYQKLYLDLLGLIAIVIVIIVHILKKIKSILLTTSKKSENFKSKKKHK
ncbi:unnamed protein product [Arctia plantaginis]|uniref:UDP-glucuronosyltransferase n=1 Tax=Arctia plantaginis TaxID=874455 RepID=A0A8S0ZY35_ARCPL|nr:unnamed protein product [Arctia plantaginis]